MSVVRPAGAYMDADSQAVRMNGADVLAEVLLANDVTVCFANPGTSEMHFVAALDRKPELRCVLGLSEGVVTGAADGYARMTGHPAATLLHTGPGLANGLANLHNARRARTPMINIVGDHASYHLPLDAPLTTDIEGLAAPMSNWMRRVNGPLDVGPTAEAAYRASLSPPGVATMILPADAAWGKLPRLRLRERYRSTHLARPILKRCERWQAPSAPIRGASQRLSAEPLRAPTRLPSQAGSRLRATLGSSTKCW